MLQQHNVSHINVYRNTNRIRNPSLTFLKCQLLRGKVFQLFLKRDNLQTSYNIKPSQIRQTSYFVMNGIVFQSSLELLQFLSLPCDLWQKFLLFLTQFRQLAIQFLETANKVTQIQNG